MNGKRMCTLNEIKSVQNNQNKFAVTMAGTYIPACRTKSRWCPDNQFDYLVAFEKKLSFYDFKFGQSARNYLGLGRK